MEWRCKAIIRGIPSRPLGPDECDNFAEIHHIHKIVIEKTNSNSLNNANNANNHGGDEEIPISVLENEFDGKVIAFNDE